jgi:hypothetical protein
MFTLVLPDGRESVEHLHGYDSYGSCYKEGHDMMRSKHIKEFSCLTEEADRKQFRFLIQ